LIGSGVQPIRASVPGAPVVMIIGDSVATGMSWHNDAIAVMQKNLNVDWEVGVCRTLIGQSCQDSATGEQPPTLVDLVGSLPSVPPTVVVEMGYNDPESTFASAVDDTMQALLAKGATHVLWLTLRASRGPYPDLNQILEAKALQDPQLQLVDWDALAAPHPEWFQDDGVHLVDAGGVAMAHLVHGAVVALFTPLHVLTLTLPAVRGGRSYATALRAAGGTAPYRWRVSGGRPPQGIHLLPNGRVYGRPTTAAASPFSVTVTDADGMTATGVVDA
jgi:hypothetical protein